MPLKNNEYKHVRIEQDQHGIVQIIRHQAEQPTAENYFEQLEEFVSAAGDMLIRADCIGLIYQSPIEDPEADYASFYEAIKAKTYTAAQADTIITNFLDLKKIGKPIVAVLQENTCGLQFASLLWADYRIATKDITVGFTELKQGLFPGFGATALCIRLLGLEKALSFLFAATPISAKNAQHLGAIDQVTSTLNDALRAAVRWIMQGDTIRRENERLEHHQVETLLTAARKKDNGLIPARAAFLNLLATSCDKELNDAIRRENKAWFDLWHKAETRSMVRTFYYAVQQARMQSTPPKQDALQLKKIGILGAGIMGSGIAYEAARAGISVVLKDINQAAAEHGKTYAEKLTDRLVQNNAIDNVEQEQLLNHILPTERLSDLQDADLIIEAVFEDKHLKSTVTQESLPFLRHEGIFASNTTSLPITSLATVSLNPQNFIGMHFFSPVDRMPLVEIIRGKETSDETLVKALYVAHRLQKVPIVVFDGPAFFTSRIFFNYLLEAISLLLEGIPAPFIEQEARKAGFAIGPLAVLDEISLKLMLQVYDQFPLLHASQQRCYSYLSTLIEKGRNGRKTGKGFYNYDSETGKRVIWEDETITKVAELPSSETVQKRLLHVMALDSYRCLEEGILTKPEDGDMGSILGVGYAAQTGGVFGHIDQVGLQTFVQECASFSAYGEQWQIPDHLQQLASVGFTFYTDFNSNWRDKDN